MTTPHQTGIKQSERKPTRRRRLASAFGLALFLTAALFLLATIAFLTVHRRTTQQRVASLESKRNSLQEIVDRREAQRKQADNDKRILQRLLMQCRAAVDIPDLQGNRVVAHHQGVENLRIYVPAGSHTLEISTSWKPSAAPNATAEAEADESAPVGEKTWTVPLRSASGYWLELDSDRQGGPIQWELTSNHPEFQTQHDTVPLDAFSHRGSSWSGSSVVCFPNQIEYFTKPQLESAGESPLGVLLSQATLRGARHEQPYEVAFDVRFLSEGPACISASEASRAFILGLDDRLLPYEGGGKYEIRMAGRGSP